MHLFWTVIFLLFRLVNTENEGEIKENVTAVLEGTSEDLVMLDSPDFRCLKTTLKEFRFDDHFRSISYITRPDPAEPTDKVGCSVFMNHPIDTETKLFYPRITGRDPMMPFYIDKLQQGIEITAADFENGLVIGDTPLTRRKYYCAAIWLVGSAFLEYWESFRVENETCKKMTELINDCHIFRQVRDIYNSKLYEKLCLDEDGCYNVMKYYAEDLPNCVKYTAISQFKNASTGSWHHSIINYCHLRDMVPQVTEAKYEQSILKGKTKGDLTKMCLYLRHRLLPEEGKETAMPDPDQLDYPDDTTTAQYGSSGISEISTFWTVAFVLADYVWVSPN